MKLVSLWKQEARRSAAQKAPGIIIAAAVMIAFLICMLAAGSSEYRDYANISRCYFSLEPNEREEFLGRIERSTGALADIKGADDLPAGLIPDDYHKYLRFMREFDRFRSDRESVARYGEYLTDIQKQYRKMQILAAKAGGNDYSLSKMQRISADYAKLVNITPVFDHNAGIYFFMRSPGLMILSIIASMLLALFGYARDRDCLKILRTTAGGSDKLIMTKLGYLSLRIFVLSFLIQGIYFIPSCFYLGCGDLFRPIQSVYTHCILPFSVAETMLLAAVSRALACVLFALIVLFISILIPYDALTVFFSILFPIAGWLLQDIKASNDITYALKSVNICALFLPEKTITAADYINILGKPVWAGHAVWSVCFISLALLIVLCRWGHARLEHTPCRIKALRFRLRVKPAARLAPHEICAFLFGRKGGVLIVLFLIALCCVYHLIKPEMTLRDQYLYYYIEEAKKEEDPLAYLEAAYDAALCGETVNPNVRQALSDGIDHYSTLILKQMGKEEFVFDRAYELLLTDRTGWIVRTCFTLLAVVLFAWSFQERGLEKLIFTCPGRVTLYRRYAVFFSLAAALILTLFVQGLYYYMTWRVYPMPDPEISASAMHFMSAFFKIRIRDFIMLLYLFEYMLTAAALYLCIHFRPCSYIRRGSG